jgi:hypothetical protein
MTWANIIYDARNSKKKSSDEQFLQAPRYWQKCSALGCKFKLQPIVEIIISRKSHHRNGPMIAQPD